MPEAVAREVQREIWLADIRGEQQPPPQALTTSSLASQEQQLLGAGSSVVSCLLEGPVQLGPGNFHCPCTKYKGGFADQRALTQSSS